MSAATGGSPERQNASERKDKARVGSSDDAPIAPEAESQQPPPRPLLQRIQEHSQQNPDAVALTWIIDEQGREGPPLTYGQLWRAVLEVAAHLQDHVKLREGDRALIIYEPSIDFLLILLACMYSGVIGVPQYPPINMERDGPKMLKINENCTPKYVLRRKR